MITLNYRGYGPRAQRSRTIALLASCTLLWACGGGGGGGGGTTANSGGSVGTNAVPVIMGTPPTTVVQNSSYAFTPAATDADLDTLTYSITNAPAWSSFNTSNGSLTGTPDSGDIGTTNGIMISVTDGIDTVSLPSFSVTVTGQSGGALQISATQPDTYEWGVLSVGQNSYIDRNYSITNIPAALASLDYLRTANDDKFISGPDAITFNVNLPVTVYIGFDSRNSSLPVWLQSWTDAGMQISTTDTVLDLYKNDFSAGTVSLAGNAVGGSMYIVIVESGQSGGGGGNPPPGNNAPPTISGSPGTNVQEGTPYSFQPSANDANGDALVFDIANKPAWASFSTASGALTGTPTVNDIATYQDIVISVFDGTASASLPAFNLIVSANSPPPTGSATLSWIPPSTNADGSTLNDLAGYRLRYGTSLGNYTESDTINSTGISSYVVSDLSAGTWFFVLKAVDTSGNESADSNVASKTVTVQ